MEPLYLTSMEGQQLMDDLKRGAVKGMIELNGNLISVGSIKAIQPDAGDPDRSSMKHDFQAMMDEIEQDTQKRKAQLLALSPKDRAQNIGLARVMWRAIKGRDLEGEEKAAVIAAQERFFEKNPNWGEANPSCYLSKHDITERTMMVKRGEMVTIEDAMAVSVTQFAERQVQNYIG